MLPKLFFHELAHLFLSLSAGAVCYFLAQRERKKIRKELFLWGFLGALLGGFFVDLDHGIEYLLAYGLTLDFAAFFGGQMFVRLDKIYVLGHAWEWLLILTGLSFFIKNKKLTFFVIGLTLGLFTHLVFDQYSNGVHMFGYSIIYRMLNGFDLSAMSGS